MIPVSGTLSADGQTAQAKAAGEIHFHAQGTWGSGTAVIQYLASDGTWRPIANSALTDNGDKLITLTQPAKVRVSLTGSSSPSIFWEIR